jgi:D-inositol-3-phosphate glycosyltransferase
MNVYVRELSRELGRMGVEVDVYTRSQNSAIPRVVALGERAHVIHVMAGPEAPVSRERLADHLDEFVEGVEEWRIARGDYDLIYAHYWLSGEAGLALRARWGCPCSRCSHAGAAQELGGALPGRSSPCGASRRRRGSCGRWIASWPNRVERDHLVRHYGAEPPASRSPRGVDTGLFRPGDGPAARRGRARRSPAGALRRTDRPIKGLDILFDAVASPRGGTARGAPGHRRRYRRVRAGHRHTCAGSSRSASWARAFAFSDPSPRTSSASTTWPRT